MKIKYKINLGFFMLVLFAGVVLLSVLSYYGQKKVEEIVGGNSFLLARETMENIDRRVGVRMEQVQALAQDLSKEKLLLDSNKAFDQLPDRDGYINNIDQQWKEASESGTSIELSTEINENLLSQKVRDNFERKEFYLKKYGYPVFAEVFLTNKYGVNVAQTENTSDFLQADESWWEDAKNDGLSIENIQYDQSAGMYSLAISSAIYDEEGQFLGVVKAVLNLKEVIEVIQEKQLANVAAKNQLSEKDDQAGKKMDFELITEDGRLLFSSRENYTVFEIVSTELIDRVSSMKKDGFQDYFFGPGSQDKNHSSKVLFALAHSRGYRDFNGLGWILSVEQNADEVLAPVYGIRNLILWLFGVTLLGVMLLSNFISGLILKHLEILHHGTEEIEKGNLDHKVGTSAHDEIGQLSRSFDGMVKAIKKSRAEVDRKVREQTKEIKENAQRLAEKQSAILNILEDMEEEKEETKKERDKINVILHSIGDGVFVVDSNLQIILVNKVTEKISGFSEEELVGKKYDKVLKFVFENDESKVNERFLRDALQTGKIQEMSNHTVLIRKNGTKIPVADSAAPLKNKNGEVIGCVVVFRDVAKEREVDRAKTEFVSLASHQLRTPLSAINWYTEMLLAGDAGKLNKNQKEYLEEVYSGSQRMVDLVNALLNVSRLELGTFTIEPVDTDFGELVSAEVKDQLQEADKKKISINLEIEKGLSNISVDPRLTRMIVQNLLSNAIKYTPEKGKISIKLGKKAEMFELVVSDTGMGIPKDQQDKIFSKMFRADNVRQTDTEGTGLGLYIIKSILDNTNGKIAFKSRENKGTEFHVEIPLAGMKKKKGLKSLS